MYVVKVGEYYIQDIDIDITMGLVNTIVLSKEMMRNFKITNANALAKLTNGEVIEITDEVTNA